MRNNFLNLVAKMPQNTGGGTSRTKNRSVTVNLSSDTTTNREMTERRPREDRGTFVLGFLKYAACMLMILFMGIGQMWADTDYVLIDYSTNPSNPAKTDNFINTTSISAFSSSITFTEADESTTTLSHYVAATNKVVSGQAANDGHFVYDLKTTSADVKIYVYNKNNSSDKSAYVSLLSECEQENETITVKSKKAQIISKSVTCTTGGTRIVISGNSGDVQFAQIIITEKGSAVKSFGEDGYTLDGKRVAVKDKSGYYDGAQIVSSSDVKYMNADICKPTTSSNKPSGFIKFTTPNNAKDVLLTIGHSSSKAVVIDELSALPTSTTGYSQLSTAVTETKAKLGPNKTYMIFSINSTPSINTLAFSIPKVTYNANGGSGTMDATEWTVDENGFTAPEGKKFDKWTTSQDGTGTDVVKAVGAEVTENTTLYAQWKADVAEYTVTYKDGETILKSVNVNVTSAPEAYTPTKALCSFAGWKDGDGNNVTLSSLASSAAKNDVITLYAQWTKLYAQSVDFTSYLLETERLNKSLATVIEENGLNYTCGGTFSNSEWGKTSGEDAAFQGYKFKDKNVYIEFRVEANKHVTLLFGNYGATGKIKVGDADAVDCTLTDSKYEINTDAEVIIRFTTNTTSGSTVTLKKITISSLYTASYVDATGDGEAGGDDENVSEVTLPTPSATTVTVAEKTYTFTGWTPSTGVKVGGVDKGTSDVLTAGTVVTLLDNTTFTAQWQEVSDFDVKFFPGYGENAEIGTTQKISTNGNATAPTDPERDGYRFLGWSTDGTEANIKDIATYAITTATNFTAVWKKVWTVTFDGAGSVEVENGETVASPNSPVQAGKVFQGWYNEEVKYDFSSAVASNLALTSKWADADPNHYVYAYNDDFHFDGVVYKTPEGKVDNGDGNSNKAITTPYTLFSGAGGITSIVMTDGIYDSKAGAIQAVTSHLKVNNTATSKLTITIKSGYTATLKIKAAGYSASRTMNVSDATPASLATPTDGKIVTSNAMTLETLEQQTFTLSSGSHDLTVTGGTLYISEMDIEAEALPTHTVTYKAGEGTGADVVDANATEVATVPGTFTAPTGTIFNGWKDETNADVEVGAIVSSDMTLTAQWINHYAVTFNMNGHGDAIDPQDIKEGAKATRPDDPIAIGFDFGGWFTDEECTAGNEFDFNTSITAATPLYAKWTAFDGCAMLYPATSGTGSGDEGALAVGDVIAMQTGSFGGSIKVAGLNGEGTIAYNTKGLSFSNGGNDSVRVTLNNELKNGSVIKLRIMANGVTHNKGRGLNLYNAANAKKALLGWQANEAVASGDVDEFTYTVEEGDGFAGTNIFILQRQNSVFLQSIKVTNCGDAIVYHNVTSAVDPEGKGTVTLGASSVREGRTTTAEYSAIDPLYEFVNWTVSGAGASVADATANPATITVGTEDAVVTLNLRLIPVKFTVNYYDGETLMGTEQVAVTEHPTASEIVTTKRHYTFLGWSTTNGGDVVALNTITRTEAGTINLYAKYEAVACPTSGIIFSMAAKENELDADVQPNGNTIISLEPYATISGGEAKVGNFGSSKHIKISKGTSVIQFTGSNAFMYMLLDCQLQEGDTIKLEDTEKFTLSIDSLKTKKADIAKNTHFYVVPSEWAGADTILVWRNGNNVSFSSLQVIRPAKYNVSFDLKDHGSAIAAITNVLEGSKITAPTAPTDEDYRFAGWYKENTLENAWDFNADVVEANTTLYAKWLDKSDATLKSLKYGTTEIELQAGVYEYNVELPSLTTSVPALTAVTNNPNAEATVTDDDAFDGVGHASSTVEVTPEKEGAAHLTYTVNFTKLPSMPLLDVENSIVWDFANAGTQNNTFTDEVLANFPGVTNDATFSAQTLKASGAKIKEGYLQGTPVLFHATKAGLLRVEFANTGGSARPYRYLVVNGVRTAYKSNNTTHVTTAWIEVPAGDVTIEGECVEDANGACTSDNLNFYKIEFLAVGHERAGLVVGDLGTVCLPNASIARGVTVYEYQGADAIGKIVFDGLGANDTLEAGKPYIFQVNETNARFFYTTDAAAGSPDNSKALKGNLDADAIIFQPGSTEAAHVYFVKDHAFWMAKNTGVKIGQYRCYLQMDEVQPVSSQNPAPGRRRIVLGVQGEQVATGIDELNASEAPVKVMIDGQLFIIRGEKMYNANGQLVK